MMPRPYFVYLLKCADGTFYCGITTDLDRRVNEHNSSSKGAKYTKGRRPAFLAYSKMHASRSEALKEEARIKKLPTKEKNTLTLLQ